ncbi:unnamed protein product [Arctogadus glacialis]
MRMLLQGRMRATRLLARVDRLPTIDEMPEAPRDSDDSGAEDSRPHTAEDYVDSIRALSQPASSPRHGPPGRRRRWKARLSTGANRRCHAVSPLATTRPVTHDPGTPVVPGEVSLAAGGAGATCETWPGLSKDPLACLFAQPHGHRAGLGGTPLMEMPG